MTGARWKQALVHEAIEYAIVFAYLAAFLVAFAWYRRLILAEYHVHYTYYWTAVIEAAVLAKVVMVAISCAWVAGWSRKR